MAVTQTVYEADGKTVLTDGTTYYDELERPILANQRALASGTYNRTELRYDNLGRVLQVAFPCTWTDVATTCPNWSTTSYDLINRPLSVSRPISATDSNPQTTTYTYSGDTTVVTDPQGNTQTTVTDPNGWLRQSTDAAGYSITIAYDAAGSEKSVLDNSSPAVQLWSGNYAYGIQPFLVSSSDADRGQWDYTVDALGERLGWTDAKGQSFSETYDALSRPLTRREPDLFTQWTWGSSGSAHNVDKLQSVCTGTGTNPTSCTSGYTENDSYDADGRLAQRAILLPGDPTYTYTWQYDANTGLLSTLTYPTDPSGYAFKLQYGYQNGILDTVTDISDTPNIALWTACVIHASRARISGDGGPAFHGMPGHAEAGRGDCV